MSVARAAFSELSRNLWRPSSILVFLSFLLISFFALLRGGYDNETYLFGSLGFVRPFLLWFCIPLAAAVVGGSSLAEDRQRGYHNIVLTHGLSRRGYFLSKLVGASLAGAIVVMLGLLSFFLVAALMLPWENSLIPENSLGPLFSVPGPMPTLFIISPLLNDLLSVLMLSFAAASLVMLGTLIGTLFASVYLTIALTFILVIASFYIFYSNGPLIINPLLYLDIWWSYKFNIPENMQAYAAFAYWAVIGLSSSLIAWFIFSQKES